jgi:chemotaxis protein methyltransferase CheR
MSSLAVVPPTEAPIDMPGDVTGDVIDRLLGRIEVASGIDFRHYAPATLVRRLWACAAAEGMVTPGQVEAWLSSDPSRPSRLTRLVLGLTGREAPLFSGVTSGTAGEVAFWSALREKVIPLLRTYPSINLWVPGGGAGATAYALAIVLHEEGLHERSRIYATDLAETVVERGRSGVVSDEMLVGAAAAYTASGGKASLATYLVEDHDGRVLLPLLRERITFAQHSLATDASFNEFQFILCRDVLADFEPAVARRGYQLLHESSCRFGIVALGARDRPPADWRDRYEDFAMTHQLYRKIV